MGAPALRRLIGAALVALLLPLVAAAACSSSDEYVEPVGDDVVTVDTGASEDAQVVDVVDVEAPLDAVTDVAADDVGDDSAATPDAPLSEDTLADDTVADTAADVPIVPPVDVVSEDVVAADVPGDDSQGPTVCIGDDDDRITADELAVDPSVETTFDVSVLHTVNLPDTTVDVPDLEGTWRDGVLHWDFGSYDPTLDHVVEMRLQRLEDHWFGAEFPDGDYADAMDAEGEVLGIYAVDRGTGALLLLGMASVVEDDTLLRYDVPVELYRFPIEKDAEWQTIDTEASGVFEGQRYPLGTLRLLHTYRFVVDRVGEVTVPAGDFRALRVSVEVETRAVNLGFDVATSRRRMYLWLSECVGLVARVGSEADELSPRFETAREFRRLGFPLQGE